MTSLSQEMDVHGRQRKAKKPEAYWETQQKSTLAHLHSGNKTATTSSGVVATSTQSEHIFFQRPHRQERFLFIRMLTNYSSTYKRKSVEIKF